MDIGTQSEVVLREAGYETWPSTGGPVPCVCFENESILALAGLLARRLSTTETSGSRIDLGFDADGEPVVERADELTPMPAGVLRRASGWSVA
jgi:hypothetical protein